MRQLPAPRRDDRDFRDVRDDGALHEPRLMLRLAWAAAAWERLWLAAWPLAAVAGLFVAVAVAAVLPALAGWLHLLALLAFAGALGWTGWRAVRTFSLPDRTEARRRLERDSGLAHRPLSALLEAQATGRDDPASRALWRLHRERLRAAARRLRVRLPAPVVAARDPYALRGVVMLLLVVAVAGAGPDWAARLGRTLSPELGRAEAAPPPTLDLFITPPAYTGLAPVYLQGGEERPGVIDVAEGSTLLARVSGGGGTPTLTLGDADTAFAAVDDSSFEVEAAVTEGRWLAVSQRGTTLGSWPIRVIPDFAPAIAFTEPPAGTERAALRLDYTADDDYGIETVTATVRLADDAEPALAREPVELELTVPGHRPQEAEAVGYFDLTPHPWAGQPVTVQLAVTDAAGQAGLSDPAAMILPEREFTHPIARAIIEERRRLMLHPEQRIEVAESLETLAVRPDRYYDDIVVFMALRSASRRLLLARDVAAHIDPVQRLLWDTALRIEDGNLSLAERDLREAQQALMEALSSDASDEEVRRLMDELRAAMDRYMSALQQTLMEQLARGEEMPRIPFDPDAMMLDRDMLEEMLDRMQQLSESGARDAARQMLAELQAMMENLQTGPMMPPEGTSQAMQMLEDLQALIRAQQALLDQTFRQAQPGAPGQEQDGEAGDPAAGAATQEGLRRALGELMRELGEMLGGIPQNLGRAEGAMRRSEQALCAGLPQLAVDPQTEALDELQQGLQSAIDQTLEQMARQGMMPGMMPGAMPQGMSGRDPLGRPLGNRGFSTEHVDIPDEAEIQRAREILDELRRRFGQRHRPELELDYIDRLLRRF